MCMIVTTCASSIF